MLVEFLVFFICRNLFASLCFASFSIVLLAQIFMFLCVYCILLRDFLVDIVSVLGAQAHVNLSSNIIFRYYKMFLIKYAQSQRHQMCV